MAVCITTLLVGCVNSVVFLSFFFVLCCMSLGLMVVDMCWFSVVAGGLCIAGLWCSYLFWCWAVCW